MHTSVTFLAVGTSVRNLVFVLQYSFRQLQCRALSVVYLPYVDHLLELLKSSHSLQAAISNMNGIGGKAAWSWIFSLSHRFLRSLAVKPNVTVVLEGLTTFLAGAASFWIIQDFPDTAKFLTEAERTVVIRRLQVDDQFSAAGESFKMKYIYKSIIDWKTWIGSGLPITVFCDWSWLIFNFREIVICYVGGDMPLYAFSLFLPTIINQVCYKPYILISCSESKISARYDHPC